MAIDAGNELSAALFMSAGAQLSRDVHTVAVVAAPYRAIYKRRMGLVRRIWETTEHVPDPRPGYGYGAFLRNKWLAAADECGHADVVEDLLG